MHGALLVSEILAIIFRYVLDIDHRQLAPPRRSLAHACRVCRAWRDPALAIIWHTIDSLLPLMRLFPRDAFSQSRTHVGLWVCCSPPLCCGMTAELLLIGLIPVILTFRILITAFYSVSTPAGLGRLPNICAPRPFTLVQGRKRREHLHFFRLDHSKTCRPDVLALSSQFTYPPLDSRLRPRLDLLPSLHLSLPA